MFVSEAVQFEPNRKQPMGHAPLLKSERVDFCRGARMQGFQETFDASRVGHRGFSSCLLHSWPVSPLRSSSRRWALLSRWVATTWITNPMSRGIRHGLLLRFAPRYRGQPEDAMNRNSVAAAGSGGKTTLLARLRRDLRVIDGETLLQKLSDLLTRQPQFCDHRRAQDGRAAAPRLAAQPAPGWQNSGGAIRVYNGCSCATPAGVRGGDAVAHTRPRLSFLAPRPSVRPQTCFVPTRARDAVSRRPAQGWTRSGHRRLGP